jgi:DNA-binding NarL/FixJ family response regulator
MQSRVPIAVHAEDPILLAGVVSQLRMRPEVEVIDPSRGECTHVAVVVAEVLDDATKSVLRAARAMSPSRVVLVLRVIDDDAVVAAAEAGVSGLLRRCEATPDVLIRTVRRVFSGDGIVPPDLLARLLGHVGQLQRQVLAPRGLRFTGLSDRELQVLRLVADGYDTGEIATKLSYSQRTVKNVLHGVTTRLQLRNRSHAVAYAVREGLI